jgi:hypothetical protein
MLLINIRAGNDMISKKERLSGWRKPIMTAVCAMTG